MRKLTRRAMVVTAAAVAVAAGGTVPVALAHDDRGLAAIGLINTVEQSPLFGTALRSSLVAFDTDAPGTTREIGPVTGLEGELFLLGIDYRVQNGKLYGLGGLGGIYTIDEGTAVATKVGQLSVDLRGTFHGVDVNPAAGANGALRIIGASGQNLRQPFGPGDGTMGSTVVDTPLNRSGETGDALGVSAAAYTNNDLSADTGTRLFDIDTMRDQFVLQDPPNDGTLVPVGPEGSLPSSRTRAGLDIYSTVEDGQAVDNDAFAVLDFADGPHLLTVDLATGLTTDRGRFDTDVEDLAITLDQ